MKRSAIAVLFLALGTLAGLARPAAAQTPAPPPPPAVQPPPSTPADIQAWFDALLLVQAQKALSISDEQYPQFVGRVKALQDSRRRTQRQRLQVLQEIQRLLDGRSGQADEAALRQKMKTLDDLREKAAAELRKAYDDLDQVLDVRQQARFRVFEERMERRKFEFLLNARRARQGLAGRGR